MSDIEPADHDPHTSVAELVVADFPSDYEVKAYLLELRQPGTRGAAEPLTAIEFAYPGEETTSVLLTMRQLRCLHEAFGRLLAAAAS